MQTGALRTSGVLQSLRRWCHFYVMALVLWLLTCHSAIGKACDASTPIVQALREVTLHGHLIDRVTVNLPDQLSKSWWREGIKVQYTLNVLLCDGAEKALWLPRVGAPYQLWIDGSAKLPIHPFIASPPENVDTLPARTFNGRTSMLFLVPKGTQQVQVQLQTLPYIPAGIAHAEIGPFEEMLSRQMRSYAEQAGGMTVISFITALIGFLAVVLWRTRQRDKFIFWFGLMCLLWGIRGYFYASDAISVPPLIFELINPFSVGLFAITCLQTTLLLGRSTARYNRFFTVVAGTLILSYLLILMTGIGVATLRATTFAVALLMLSYIGYLIWRERMQLGVWRAALIVAGFISLIAASLHDIAIIAGILSPDRTSLVLLGFTTLLVAYAVVCAHFVIRTLNLAEASNEVLEARVQEKMHPFARRANPLSGGARQRARPGCKTKYPNWERPSQHAFQSQKNWGLSGH